MRDVAIRRRSKVDGAGSLAGIAAALAVGALTARTVLGSDAAPAVLSVLLLLLSVALFRRREWPLFAFSFAVNLVTMLVVAHYYVASTGSPFGPGGDELTFFLASSDVARDLLSGYWRMGGNYSSYSGYGFILIGGALNALLSGLGPVSPFTIRVANAFVGAAVGPAVYRIAKAEYADAHPKMATWAGVASGCFPTLIAYAASGLRDIWLVSASAWIAALLIAPAREGRHGGLGRKLGVVLLMALVYLLRPESLAPVLVLLAAWSLLTTRRVFAAVMLIGYAVLVVGTTQNWMPLVDTYEHQRTAYETLALSEADAGSLGAALLRLPGPISGVARVAFTAYAPVPPAFSGGPDRWLVALGALVWYYVLPLGVVGIAIAWKKGGRGAVLAVATAASACALLVGIGLTSSDVRHKTVVMPFAILFAVYTGYAIPFKRLVQQLIGLSVAYGLLFAVYMLIKT